MAPIKARCRMVFGIDEHGIRSDFRLGRARKRIGQQCRAKPTSLPSPINSQPSEANSWDEGIARQLLRQFRRQIRERDATSGERVVTHDPTGRR